MESSLQLQLDFGVLTAVQQEKVDRFIERSKRDADDAITRTAKIEELLISGGFQAGIDYVNNLETKTVTETEEFGYGDDEFTAEVTYVSSYGGCQLITDYYNQNQNIISAHLVHVNLNSNKLECTRITNQYRAYKPATLLTKLKEYNASQKYKFERANKEKTILDYTVEKYKTLFPNAEVSIGTDYNRRSTDYTWFPIVIVSFKSGSYVSFRLGYEIDNEYLHKKFDAVASKMTTAEVLNMFNNQEAK
jgi:hypothetical protein